MIYQHSFCVNSHSCDCHGIVRPSAVMTYLQEPANLQLESCGPTDAEMRAAGRFFVLSRIAVHLYHPLFAYEALRAETWAAPSRGFSFFRCHRILRGDTLLVEATSVWALLDMTSRRPIRTTEYHPNFDTEPLSECGVPERIGLPQGEAPLAGKYTVRYADTDRNGHMNNTVYADMLCGFLDMQKKRVRRLFINYFNEAPLGEQLLVHTYPTKGDEHFFRTVRADGKTNVEAALLLESI